ncbi:hypothetical protein KVT40_009274 [Elsinoe batatas]|uniref:Amino acid permease/ SLC12A domain-containing protein n=1 Tax=Elsinoe batatas TaxID=2601811 RepID=A0A8K0KYV8_9PEZI|nr:hypothetical protein KVT40_009274 [Elsinoe batatas]
MSISNAPGRPLGSGDYEKEVGQASAERRGSRKASVMDAIKSNYALNEDDDYSIKKGDSTHRKLRPRHIQLIGIGGTIGTALFVQIGRGLLNGGPAALFLAFTIWCFVTLCVTNFVLSWFVSLVTASQLLNFAVMCFTYVMFKRALEAQGIDRNTLVYKSWFQPYMAYFAGSACLIMAFVGGYPVFLPGAWNVPTFLFSYTMIFNMDEIAEYEANYVPEPYKHSFDKWFNKIFS